MSSSFCRSTAHIHIQHKTESFIVLSIAAVICLSAVAMAYQALVDFARDPAEALQAGSLCGAK